MKKIIRIVAAALVFGILIYLPVVPVYVAPVVINSSYALRMKSIHQILRFALDRPDGISYELTWLTYAAIFGLLAVGSLLSLLMFKSRGRLHKIS